MSGVDYKSRAKALDTALHRLKSRGASEADRIEVIESALREACVEKTKLLAAASRSLVSCLDTSTRGVPLTVPLERLWDAKDKVMRVLVEV